VDSGEFCEVGTSQYEAGELRSSAAQLEAEIARLRAEKRELSEVAAKMYEAGREDERRALGFPVPRRLRAVKGGKQ
jgi:hypothetical protein